MATTAYVVYVMGRGRGGIFTKLFLHFIEEKSTDLEESFRLHDDILGASVWATEKDAREVAEGLNTPFDRGFRILELEADLDENPDGGET